MDIIALLMAPVGGLLLGLVVYVIVTRETRRYDERETSHPAE